MDEIKEKFTSYLRHKMRNVTEILVKSVGRIHGGASRETYRVRASWKEDGVVCERGLIVRREPVAGLIDTECETEFRAFEAFYKAGLPVPKALFIEHDAAWLDRPFIVMSEIEHSRAGSPLTLDPYGVHADSLGKQFFDYLGRIVQQDPEALGLTKVLQPVAVDESWKRELNHWEKVVKEGLLTPEPVVEAAIRWLRRNPPPPAQKMCVVHGDYRSGNFMFDDKGEITAILDWEMAHLGDPLEDLAWAIDPIWAFRQPQRAGGLIDRAVACQIWEQSAGLKIDPSALRWWELFSHVKGAAIWATAANEFHAGKNLDLTMVVAAWYPSSFHENLIAKKLLELNREARP